MGPKVTQPTGAGDNQEMALNHGLASTDWDPEAGPQDSWPGDCWLFLVITVNFQQDDLTWFIMAEF